MQIKKNTVVAIDYTLTDKNGEVMDSSKAHGPLSYIHGNGNLISGLEKKLEGKKPGDSLTVSVPPEEGYGVRDEKAVQVLSREVFKGVESLEVGMQFQVQQEEGDQIFTVVAIEGDKVTVDGNHPLAGETLNFEVTVVSTREATEEEIEHGHVHEQGGHHHH